MLPVLILAVALSVPSHGVTVTSAPAVTVTHHVEHVRHERHLAHLHAEHLRHLADRESWRILADLYPGADVPSGYVPPGVTLSCRQLEDLWVAVGGATSAAFIAAEIARAESGGYQYATGAAGERGFWQINPVNGALSTYDKVGNARAAIIISDDGRDWTAWTTYTHGLYVGQCLAAVTSLAWFVGFGRSARVVRVYWPDRVDDALLKHSRISGGS